MLQIHIRKDSYTAESLELLEPFADLNLSYPIFFSIFCAVSFGYSVVRLHGNNSDRLNSDTQRTSLKLPANFGSVSIVPKCYVGL
jgi:hypothetical protein